MRTAEEMAQYCQDNNTGSSVSKKWRLKHFKVVEEQLGDEEEVTGCFMGLHNYKSLSKHDGNYAYAVTPKRIIAGQKKVIGNNVSIIQRKNLNDVQKSTGALMGIITLDTFKEKIKVQVDKNQAESIHKLVLHSLFEDDETSSTAVINNQSDKSVAEELKEFKELLDMEIITQEDFDKKKAELLG